jgi:acyl-CoA oxidase
MYFSRDREKNACVCFSGKCATHAVVYAQLITPDGTNHGLHAFVVPIRNTSTLLPFPGVTVGDLGEKIALNGVDNGFVMFQNYGIPRDNLLNKTADVSPEGQYISCFKDPRKRMGKNLVVIRSFICKVV